MIKSIIHFVRIAFPVAAIMFSVTSNAQYWHANNKDNTRPEVNKPFNSPLSLQNFTVVRNNGYNDIQWAASAERDTRTFMVEYSTDGIIYQTAGRAIITNNNYVVRHNTLEVVPMLYRIRSDAGNGQTFYSKSLMLEGVSVEPVKIFPTAITGNVVNVVAYFPVERVTVLGTNGQQVHAVDLGGKTDNLTITVPSLAKGIYFMHFTGQGWKSSSKFIVQ